MGKWCDYECLSGSDGALRMALGLCDAAGTSYTTWPDDVQDFSHLKPDYSGEGVVVTLQAVTDAGPGALICQALPDTYRRIVEVIDSTTAEQWVSHFMMVVCVPSARTAHLPCYAPPAPPARHSSHRAAACTATTSTRRAKKT